MRESVHFKDFCERLEQLTDIEAVKEAYLAYAAVMHPEYQVFKAPTNLTVSELAGSVGSDAWLHAAWVRRDEDSVQDELVLVKGPRGSLSPDLEGWLTLPCQATLSRANRLLIEPKRGSGQTEFYRHLREVSGPRDPAFAAMLTEVGTVSGLTDVLESALPRQSQVYEFTDSLLVSIIPSVDDLRIRWLARKAILALDETLIRLGESRSQSSVATFPTDAPDRPRLLLELQLGLQILRRLNAKPGTPPIPMVFAGQSVARSDGENDEGTAGHPVRRQGPTPSLSGGAARKLEEHEHFGLYSGS